MSMPPNDVTPRELWAAITAQPVAHRVIPFPRNDKDGNPLGKIAMVVLTQEQTIAAKANAEKYTRDKMRKILGEIPKEDEKSASYTSVYNSRASLEILMRSCKNPDDFTKPAFPNIEELGNKLTSDEVAVLMEEYLRTQAALSPIIRGMSEEEMEAWIEHLAEGGKEFPLGLLSPEQLMTLLVYMASQLLLSRKAKSSHGLQPGEYIVNE